MEPRTFVTCLTVFFSFSGCLASELSFLLEPSDVIAVRERQLMLDCRVQGEEPIMITWRRNGVPLPTSPRVQVLTNGTLLIQSFQKRKDGNDGDIGEYDCAAQNRYGMLVSRKAKVLLASLPKFHTHPTSMSVDEGGVARLQCQINGIPEANISWERNRVSLNTTDSRYTLLPNGVLQVTGVRRVDAGIFRCVASNIANTRFSHEAVLNVTGGAPRIYKEPVILSGPQNLTINVHQTAILECIATGNPRPIVSWSRLDGRSIGVEGIQVLGTGNLMISDVSLQHSGVYVCAANRPGTRMRRTAVGRLVVQAPPEFIQWPQSVSKPAGGSAVFTCVAQGVPEPHLVWLKNGKVLMPGHNVRLTNNNSTLVLTRISSEDEAIYQCIAENSAGTNQASARLAVAMVKDLPAAPEGLTATPLSTNTLHISWREPPPNVTDGIIGYVLHIRKIGEPDSLELQEAISKGSFQHDVNNLEEGTTYLLYLKAYSPLGASQQSHTVVSTTLGGVPAPPTFYIRVLNSTSVQVVWELPSKAGKAEGFRLSYRRVPHTIFQGPIQLPFHVNAYTITNLEAAAVYEMKLVAFNGNGESDCSKRLVSLGEGATSNRNDGEKRACQCSDEEASLGSVVIGIHIGTACIIFCVLFLVFGYRHSLFCSKGSQGSWSVPRNGAGHDGVKDRVKHLRVEPSLQEVCPSQCQVIIEHSSSSPGQGTG
ncbi:immunoglobulin superfamily DCC subclass member 3 isoform X1 [Takifugu flavidus]|uniref:immunoglobulin superfamily DCC subclass member 3 isoform X1 n=2 Tax=Takifugu flavidus TaxID=433684 RepID=UPI00254431E7|nr:immunoglobulin superfamily DCC subclass member 3 isoform X1 [Takifugu flavidus]XP_056876249.1 immunoglobulin superfamily DCC subclass member 3 isoform X1 [Takifugu flavidus]XP_056876250.1 immunoglobulin superfamily DCC subclass member 3 isoform X1 [Takifugu flavidus]